MGKQGGKILTENLFAPLRSIFEVMVFWDVPPCSFGR
jgi:hypothetical protein